MRNVRDGVGQDDQAANLNVQETGGQIRQRAVAGFIQAIEMQDKAAMLAVLDAYTKAMDHQLNLELSVNHQSRSIHTFPKFLPP